MNPNEASINALLSSVRSFLLVVSPLLAAHGLASSGLYEWVQIIAGSIVTVGMAAWGIWVAISNVIKKRQAVAVGVAAGINLTIAGKALAANGITVVKANDGTTPPLPVTQTTAAAIVRDFAPAVPPSK